MEVGQRGNMVDLDLIDEKHKVYQGSINVVQDPPRSISALILLTPDNPIWMPGVRRCEGGPLIAYTQMGIYDDPAQFPGLLWLQSAVQVAKTYVDAGWPLAILCGAGVSRSSMLTAALLMDIYEEWDVDAAITRIVAKRPSANPNIGFRAGMKEWATWRRDLAALAREKETAPPANLTGSTEQARGTPTPSGGN